jgi:SAM-dependent methyltransferase
MQLSVDVTSKTIPEPWAFWNFTKVNHGGYDPDHQAGKAILVERIKGQKQPRVLEIGGCCNPMMRGVCPDLHSIDIDMQTLQIGHLTSEQSKQSVRYICADGSNLPYREHSFDWIVMFSTLHHFSDPSQVLGNLKRFLKSNGRIATMCEPIGHYIDGNVYDAFIEELEQGINEQTFTLEEYHTMIQNAGLKVDKAIVDVGSLKLILKA